MSIETTNSNERWLIGLALGLAAIIFVLPLTIPFPLLDPDEGLHASIAQEMVEQGDWLTPHFLGEPFFDKPILFFWCQALSLRSFGPHEAAVRLPGLLFGLLGAITTGMIGWRMFGRMAGYISGIFYTTMILPAAMAQAASHDVAAIPCINLSLLFLWQSDRATSKRSAAAYVAASGLLLGVSILAKGLIGLAVVAVTYGAYVLVTRRLRLSTCLYALTVLFIAAFVASFWYIPMEVKHPGYLYYFFVQRHFFGLATPTQIHGEAPWWYYLPILIGGGLPWIGYLPITIGDTLARRREKMGTEKMGTGSEQRDCPNFCVNKNGTVPFTANGAITLLFCWLIGPTVFLSAAHSKLMTYIWPVFPSIALLAAIPWSKFLQNSLADNARRSLLRTFLFSSITGPFILPLVVYAVHKLYAVDFSRSVWIAAILAGLASLIPLVFLKKQQWRTMLAASTLSTAIQFVVALSAVFPPVAEKFTARTLAQYFNHLGKLPVRLLVAEERLGSLVFYLDPALRQGLHENQIGMIFYDQPTPVPPGTIIALPEKRAAYAENYAALAGLSYQTVGRYRLYEVSEQK